MSDLAEKSRVSAARVAALRETLQPRRSSGHCSDEVVSVGEAIDSILPDGGVRRGTLIEWLSAAPGCGAERLACVVARCVLDAGGEFVVVDCDRTFHPPSIAALGVDLTSVVLLRPPNDRAALWAVDQALRSRAVAVVLWQMERLPGRSYRRLQLSAEEGNVLGFLLRTTRTLQEPAWCDLALSVQRISSEKDPRFRVETVRSREGRKGRSAEIELDEGDGTIRRRSRFYEASPLRLVSEMGRAAPARPIERRRRKGSA
jgi:hypothetical protein